jgi:predicted RNA-binding protein with TRAM domain
MLSDDGDGEVDGDGNELSDTNEDASDISTDLVWTPGVKQINLKSQTVRVQRVIKASFKGIQKFVLFTSAFPSGDEVDIKIRSVLRDCARELGDSEIAERVKHNSTYGNAMGHLVALFLHSVIAYSVFGID